MMRVVSVVLVWLVPSWRIRGLRPTLGRDLSSVEMSVVVPGLRLATGSLVDPKAIASLGSASESVVELSSCICFAFFDAVTGVAPCFVFC